MKKWSDGGLEQIWAGGLPAAPQGPYDQKDPDAKFDLKENLGKWRVPDGPTGYRRFSHGSASSGSNSAQTTPHSKSARPAGGHQKTANRNTTRAQELLNSHRSVSFARARDVWGFR